MNVTVQFYLRWFHITLCKMSLYCNRKSKQVICFYVGLFGVWLWVDKLKEGGGTHQPADTLLVVRSHLKGTRQVQRSTYVVCTGEAVSTWITS